MSNPTSKALKELSPQQRAVVEKLRQRFAQLPDPRMKGRVLHRIDEVVMVGLCSILSDNDAFTDMEAFASSQLDWLRTFLPLANGAPSHDVFRNVFMALQPGALVAILGEWSGEIAGKQVCIDGKALRGSDSVAAGLPMVHVLRAWVSTVGISAGHEVCAEKSNELDALPRLLDSFMLEGTVVTIDAMGCHSHIAEQIHVGGGDYVLALKGNQKNTLEAVSKRFEIESKEDVANTHETAETVELSHGRFEQRTCTVIGDLEWFDKSWKWPGLKSVIKVERTTLRTGKSEILKRETHYYLSSLGCGAEEHAERTREHWSVENTCHYTLDVTFGEDDCQVRDRSAAHNLSIMRELAAKVLRDHPAKKSMRAKRKLAALDPAFRFALLAMIPQCFRA
jgi:predicted transposase YbfD/YdcC